MKGRRVHHTLSRYGTHKQERRVLLASKRMGWKLEVSKKNFIKKSIQIIHRIPRVKSQAQASTIELTKHVNKGGVLN